jgi:hypothetical protein
VPDLENAAAEFAQKYDRNRENAVLDRRKRAALLSRNVDRVSDVLELPSLLSSTVMAAQAGSAGGSSSAASTTSYASALDLHAHIKRLRTLYPQSRLVGSIATQSEVEMQNLATILITSLQSSSLKLAAAMRTIGWLRRVAPDLAEDGQTQSKANATSTKSLSLTPSATSNDGALGSLFLLCRLRTLNDTLDALEPLRNLADQETTQRRKPGSAKVNNSGAPTVSLGTQSERYLKRYMEIFREQSFSILSMYKSIFPSAWPEPDHSADPGTGPASNLPEDPLLPLPSPVSSFALHLVQLLEVTLREYMPNITDKSSRESLLTQVLYCAGSLGRLGADFGMMVALLEEELEGQGTTPATGGSEEVEEVEEDPEWAQVMKKHRIQASRLEVLARGVGTTRKPSTPGEAVSPGAVSPAAISAG